MAPGWQPLDGMKFFNVRPGAGLMVNGSQIMQQVKSRGGECIEAAGGYYVKGDFSEGELREIVAKAAETEVEIQPVDPSAVSREDMAPDLALFLGLDSTRAA